MDAAGVYFQVLSLTTPGIQQLPPALAVSLARDANDFLADAVPRRPDRFAAFATLPTSDPEAAADELRRCVSELRFVGAMVFPRTLTLLQRTYRLHKSIRRSIACGQICIETRLDRSILVLTPDTISGLYCR